MNIETYGTGSRILSAARHLGEARDISAGRHFVLLPIPSTKDKKYVKDTNTALDSTLAYADKNSVVVGYGLPEGYTKKATRLGARILDLALDEEFQRENSYVSALGAVGYLLTSSDKEPRDTKFGVVGYGKIGKALVRMLLFHGAHVKLYTSKLLTSLELGECGIESVFVSEWDGGVHDFSGLDVIINTAPIDMTKSFPLGKAENGARIIELASGENFAGIKGVEKLPSIPEKMFPESAGKIYFDAIKRFLHCEVDLT